MPKKVHLSSASYDKIQTITSSQVLKYPKFHVPLVCMQEESGELYDNRVPLCITDTHTFNLVNGLICGYDLCCVLYYCSIDDISTSDVPRMKFDGHTVCPDCWLKIQERKDLVKYETYELDKIIIDDATVHLDNNGKVHLVRSEEYYGKPICRGCRSLFTLLDKQLFCSTCDRKVPLITPPKTKQYKVEKCGYHK